MVALFKNNAFSTLASGVTDVALTLSVATGEGARFPSPTGADFFYATLIDTSNNLEIIKVTARSTDTFTIVREQESTSARAYSTSDRIELRITAAGLADIASSAVGGGAYLGESGVPNGDSSDIIRINEQTLNNSQTMVATDNGSATGPLTIASGVTLTISSGATFVVI